MGKNIQRNKVNWVSYDRKVPAREGQCKLVEGGDMKKAVDSKTELAPT